jgi:hypothetical protein
LASSCKENTYSPNITHFENKEEKLDPKLTTLNKQFRGRLFNSKSKASLAFSIRVPLMDTIQNRSQKYILIFSSVNVLLILTQN